MNVFYKARMKPAHKTQQERKKKGDRYDWLTKNKQKTQKRNRQKTNVFKFGYFQLKVVII